MLQSKQTGFPCLEDYPDNPREDAEYAITLICNVIDHHPDVTETYRQALIAAVRILERLAD